MKNAMFSTLLFVCAAALFLAGSWYSQRGAVTAATAGARTILYYVDPMHPAFKSDKSGIAPDCGMELVPVYADGSMSGGGSPVAGTSGTVQISPERQQLLGLRVTMVEKAASTQTLRVLGRVVPDEGRVYKVNAGVEGTIREVSAVTTGSHVEKDQWLATFFSLESRTPVQAYLTALDVLDRAARMGQPPEQVRSGDATSQLGTERLRNVGMSALQIEEIRRTREVPLLVRIHAPAAGVVLARNVSLDQKFEKGTEWYRIADLRQVWILADVFEHEAVYLHPGGRAQVTLASRRQTFPATVSEVLPQFDASTRTLKVRLEVDNPGEVLRPDMFVDVVLPIALPPTIAVPVDSVLDSGLTQTVFVDRGEGRFEPRQVETGWRFGDRVQIVKGLREGERIVVAGTFLLDSESRMKLAAATAGGAITHAGHDHGAHGHGAHVEKAMLVTPVALAFANPIDPICGMEVDAGKAKTAGWVSEYGGVTYYFCSEDCRRLFAKDPASHAARVAHTAEHGSHSDGGHHHP